LGLCEQLVWPLVFVGRKCNARYYRSRAGDFPPWVLSLSEIPSSWAFMIVAEMPRPSSVAICAVGIVLARRRSFSISSPVQRLRPTAVSPTCYLNSRRNESSTAGEHALAEKCSRTDVLWNGRPPRLAIAVAHGTKRGPQLSCLQSADGLSAAPCGKGECTLQCLNCERPDPLRSEKTIGWLQGELRRPH